MRITVQSEYLYTRFLPGRLQPGGQCPEKRLQLWQLWIRAPWTTRAFLMGVRNVPAA